MKWTHPSKSEAILFLPKLQKTERINFETIQKAPNNVAIPVSDSFIDAWITPPQNSFSKEELSHNLNIVGQTLGDLVKTVHTPHSEEKSAPHDKVTLFDEGIEMLVRIWLQMHYPEHKIIGEEGAKHQLDINDTIWFIDPIDGTANFIENKDNYSIHIGSIKNGQPYVSFVGIPKKNHYFCDYKTEIKPYKAPTHLTLCTEHFPHQKSKAKRFELLLNTLNAKPVQNHSIGISTIGLLEGEITAFYKDNLKLWDIIAPLCFLKFYQDSVWDIQLRYLHPETKKTVTTSPFSNDESYINFLNIIHKQDCRTGLLTITPKDNHIILEEILNAFL